MYYRDCYGFRKASQWVTLEDHHAHEESYQAVLERRLSKWEQLLKEHESRLPERCSKGMIIIIITTTTKFTYANLLKVKRYIRKGVPAHLRGRVSVHIHLGVFGFYYKEEVFFLLGRARERGGI